MTNLREGSSSGSSRAFSTQFSHSKKEYQFDDQSGEFFYERESGYQKNQSQVIVKRQILPRNKDRSKPLERSIAISKIGKLNEITVLRPEISQYSVWFDGERYFTEMKLNTEKKGLDILIQSPEEEWSGSEFVKFPDGNGVYCFYSQLIECARVTGFISKAIEVEAGQMAFHLIWDGYPYFAHQYPGVEDNVFASAILEYDGQTDSGEYKFTLTAGRQTIFFQLTKKGEMSRKFWVAQGLSITPL